MFARDFTDTGVNRQPFSLKNPPEDIIFLLSASILGIFIIVISASS
jgi:hypothetical protein